jgi:hypothetical protein
MINDIFCVKCKRMLKPWKNGQEVIELTEKGEPYKVMQGDVLAYPKCGLQIVTHWGRPTCRHEADFPFRLRQARTAEALEVV